eukprot:1700231-Rhodomonas_salina.1
METSPYVNCCPCSGLYLNARVQFTRNISSVDCTCIPGYFGPDGGPCSSCEAGKFKDSSGSEPCAVCPSGLFKEVTGPGACSACPAGTYHNGSSRERICAACPANSRSTAGSYLAVNCTCNPGYAGPDGGPCSACEAGKFKASAGSEPCAVCPSGLFKEVRGPGNCQTCPYGLVASASSASCLSCPNGSSYTSFPISAFSEFVFEQQCQSSISVAP